MLSQQLLETLPEFLLEQEGLPTVARFLAEEFSQRDKTKTMIVSAETGFAVAEVPQDAFYQPPPVAREGTDQLVTPAPRLRPEIESAIVQANFNRGHESSVTKALQERGPVTELMKQEGDPRTLVATYKGRKQLADRLRSELPQLLLEQIPGRLGEFLKLCQIDTDGSGCPAVQDTPGHELRIIAHASVPITDQLSLNLQHDPYTALKERVRAQWVRNIARQVASFSYCQQSVQEVTLEDEFPDALLICDPDTSMALPHLLTLPVEESPAVMLFDGPYLRIHQESYVCESLERRGRWEVAAGFDLTLYLDLGVSKAFRFRDVPVSGLTVEVVS
jgi:hypothetical protein